MGESVQKYVLAGFVVLPSEEIGMVQSLILVELEVHLYKFVLGLAVIELSLLLGMLKDIKDYAQYCRPCYIDVMVVPLGGFNTVIAPR